MVRPGRFFLLVIFAISVVAAAQAPPLTAKYEQILQPALTQQATLENASAAWDALHFSFANGVMALGGPAGAETVAVFSGQGELSVTPPNPIERQQMQFFTGQAPLAVSFSQAVFRFANAAAWRQALAAGAHFQPAPADPRLIAIEADRGQASLKQGAIAGAQLLLALDAPPAAGTSVLVAELKTDKFGWLQAAFDPLDAESVSIARRAEQPAYGPGLYADIWSHFAATTPGAPTQTQPPDQLDPYDLHVTIPSDLDMQVQATMTVTARLPGRGLLLALDSNLRVQDASLAGGAALEVLQPPDPGNNPSLYYQGNWLYLRLPQPLAAGQKVQIALRYHGKRIIQKIGNGNYFAQSSGWYPTNGYGPPFQRAHFHLQFQNDKKYTLVATGDRTSSHIQGDLAVTEWDTPVPLTVAGFALGDYAELSKTVTLPGTQSVAVNVLVNNNPDDAMQAINAAVAMASVSNVGMPPLGSLDPKRLAPTVLAQVSSALQFMTFYFGPYPYSSLSVVPIPGSYGQGWPGLLYLSSLSFLDSTQLHEMGVPQAGLDQISDTFRAHETSHQWWGHRVSWASDHDQWLSEGFANASALLFQQASDGPDAALDTLRGWRRDLESKSRLGKVHDDDGPLWLGQRLASSQDPEGYTLLTYDKGGYVLYMLRQLMYDSSQKAPDTAFIAMMHDFTSTFANRDASTADFQAIVEKHMTPVMDVDHNHSMDWFFRQYVYGTGIPKLQFKTTVTPDGNRYKLVMNISNPSGWHGLLPVYIWQGKHFVRGQARVANLQESIPVELAFAPTKIVANQFLDMLVDVNQ